MRSIISTAVIVICYWAAVTFAQKECLKDADCKGHQYCYDASKVCVNYTLCKRYNRKESDEPARDPHQCGGCFAGYFATETTDGGESGICNEDQTTNHPSETNGLPSWAQWLGIAFAVLAAIAVGVWALYSFTSGCTNWRKFSCIKGRRPAESEKPAGGLLMVENGKCPPSAPPSEFMNNNKYKDAEETNPLSTAQEYCGNFTVDQSQPVKAQCCRPPNYVNTDPSYNPGDTHNQTVVTPFSSSEIDDETNPSEWTPGPPSTSTVPVRPFAAISQPVQDNTTNVRLACPSPSTSQEGHQYSQNNSSSSNNAGGFEYYNTNGNARQNPNPSLVIHMTQVNMFNKHGSGS